MTSEVQTGAAAVAAPRAGMRFWSDNPVKARVERFWLLYTPVWGLAAAIVMIGGFAHHWGDVEFLIFGVALAIPAMVGPIVWRHESERGLPFWQTVGFKLTLSVFLLAFAMNYSQTPFFYDVLHMHYGFNADVTIQNNPFFLYWMTVPYFATYSVLCMGTFRVANTGLAGAPKPARWAAIALAPFGVALLETVMNANPFMDSLFCYDDMTLMLWFGTFTYGTAFCLALPMWLAIDERPGGARLPWWKVLVFASAVMYADVLLLDMYRYGLAPHLTDVVEGANGLRDFGASCLQPIPGS